MKPSLSVVVPAFNEAARIAATLHELVGWLSQRSLAWDVRVVDDGSRDATPSIVADIAAAESRVVLQQEPHRGKGAAVRAGMLAARGERRFMCDADLSMPLHELDRFLEPVVSHVDIIIGSREGLGARRVGEPHYRHLMGRAFNAFVRRAAVPGINDTQCGFKLFTAEAAEAVFSRVTLDGWAFDVEALVIARRLGLRVHEMPIEWHFREQSRVSPFRDSILMARDLICVRRNARRGRYGP